MPPSPLPSPAESHADPIPLSSSEIERYSRQLILPQFGVTSQRNLRSGRILIIGVGGLGSPAALYLAASGIGTIGLVDRPNDVVEKSNLHRQLVHAEKHVGMNKVKSAELAIQALNSGVKIEIHEEFIPANAMDLVKTYDVVLDCTDNVMSRYLISDACATGRVPLVSGSAIGMEGQLTVYCSSDTTPCYRCIFPTPPPPSCVGSCDSAGVLGPVPGTIGTLQALEALKLVGKIRRTSLLEQRLLLFDAAETTFRNVKLRSRVKTCMACGDEPSVKVATFDYKNFAMGVSAEEKVGSDGGLTGSTKLDSKYRMTVEQFSDVRKERTKYQLIDVRPKTEFEMCHLEEAQSYPLGTLESSLPSLNPSGSAPCTVFICRRGNASQSAVQISLKNGMTNVFDIVGGLKAWHEIIDQKFPLY